MVVVVCASVVIAYTSMLVGGTAKHVTSSRRSGSPSRVVLLPHDMELHAIDEGVIVDRSSVCSTSTKSLKVGLSRQREILVCDRRERQQLDVVDLNHHGTAPVHASDLDLWSRPEPVGDCDAPVSYSISEISAELHAAIVSRNADASRRSGTTWLVNLPRVLGHLLRRREASRPPNRARR